MHYFRIRSVPNPICFFFLDALPEQNFFSFLNQQAHTYDSVLYVLLRSNPKSLDKEKEPLNNVSLQEYQCLAMYWPHL